MPAQFPYSLPPSKLHCGFYVALFLLLVLYCSLVALFVIVLSYSVLTFMRVFVFAQLMSFVILARSSYHQFSMRSVSKCYTHILEALVWHTCRAVAFSRPCLYIIFPCFVRSFHLPTFLFQVLLTPAARELYASKCPDAVAKRRPQSHVLRDADAEDEAQYLWESLLSLLGKKHR